MLIRKALSYKLMIHCRAPNVKLCVYGGVAPKFALYVHGRCGRKYGTGYTAAVSLTLAYLI